MEKSREHDQGEMALEQDSIEAVFEETLIDLAEGDVVAMEASLARLFSYTLGFSPNMAQELAGMAADHLPRSQAAEYGVRIVKPVKLTAHAREQLILRVAAYVVTAPAARFSPEEGLNCSGAAIDYAAELLRDQNQGLDRVTSLQLALEDYVVILRDYLEQTVNRMADSDTVDDYAAQLTAVTVINELGRDLRDVYTAPPGKVDIT